MKENKKLPYSLPLNPADLEDRILVVLAGDDNFAIPIAVTIASAMTHAKKEDRYLFLILSDEISAGKQEYFRQLELKYPNMKTIVYDMLPIFTEWQHLFSVHCHWKRATYFRLFLPLLLNGVQKALYLDGDLLIRCDLAQLFHLNLTEETYCAAVEDNLGDLSFSRRFYLKKTLGVPADYVYFNAGVLLLNLEALQKINFFEESIKLQKTRNLFFQDQDILNLLCRGHVQYLSNEWNHMLIDTEPTGNKKVERIVKSYPLENAKILHYSGSKKPWAFPELNYANFWWKYAVETPFAKDLELYSLRTKANFYKKRADELEKSLSVKLGLFLTWIPRKILSVLLNKDF